MAIAMRLITLALCVVVFYWNVPFFWNAVYLFAPEGYLKESITAVAEKSETEAEFIDRIQRRGFNINLPTEEPVRVRKNGGKSYEFIDEDAEYTSYSDYQQRWLTHRRNLPENFRKSSRSASFWFPLPPVCQYSFRINWYSEDETVQNLSSSKLIECL